MPIKLAAGLDVKERNQGLLQVYGLTNYKAVSVLLKSRNWEGIGLEFHFGWSTFEISAFCSTGICQLFYGVSHEHIEDI